jgi:hypothetical protein
MGIQTQHDASGTLAKCELTKTETEKLLPTGKRLHIPIPMIFLETLLKGMSRKNIGELAKNVMTGVHKKARRI